MPHGDFDDRDRPPEREHRDYLEIISLILQFTGLIADLLGLDHAVKLAAELIGVTLTAVRRRRTATLSLRIAPAVARLRGLSGARHRLAGASRAIRGWWNRR
ncbi:MULTISPECIES: hypothetical protein [Streptomyces]|uniref:Uncharacterized protein n=1 Tax=Streptomyces dengpaensis TaxID=2049881 RepID=A0ABM6SNK7_9ACTN|nr:MULTISPECIES: hypothetical protein [Streptomyces]AVH56199.1 hypothetical protein C4B68_10905 [Streptomyces dengpaensis]PIB07157.1 hypothetical protein B1C81_20780 [Streptomyces sp. HG99]